MQIQHARIFVNLIAESCPYVAMEYAFLYLANNIHTIILGTHLLKEILYGHNAN